MTTAVKETQDIYLRQFRALEKRAQGPAWLGRLRAEAMEAFAELSFPTVHLEDWKYTNVAPLTRVEFAPAAADEQAAAAVRRHPSFDLECWRLVFLNGRYTPELSRLEGLPRGVEVRSLAEALAVSPGAVEEHLARHADFKDHAFVALNTAFIEDGAFISIAKGVVLKQPIHLLYVSAPGAHSTVSHPRNLIVAGEASQAAVIEAYAGWGEVPAFTNAVTEIVAGENSRVDYVKVQQESAAAFHISTIHARQARYSNLASHSLALGSLLGREELITVLDGEGAEALLRGLYVTTGRQLIDNHTTIDHARAHCSSREFYKGVLDGASTGVFNGKIIVRPDAQKTDSKQSDKNLLLSEQATINTKPQLEIFADDVKCTHGATIGQIDSEAIFYLRSRGIGEEEARQLLVVAFGNEIIESVSHAPLRARLQADLRGRLERARAGRNP
jgi:Fe-S cluster assembly protein SufD